MAKQWKNLPDKNYVASLVDIKELKKEVVSGKIKLFLEGGIPGSEGDVKGISMTVDPNTYIMTTQLKDGQGGNVGSPATIDLPLESMVVNGEYDENNKSIVLTLKNGGTVEFSVADLVSGLQTEITGQNPLSADLIDDSSSNQKLVTGEEKSVIEEVVAYQQVQPDAQLAYIRGEGDFVYLSNSDESAAFSAQPIRQSGGLDPTGVHVSTSGEDIDVIKGEAGELSNSKYGPVVHADALSSGIYNYSQSYGPTLYVDYRETVQITDGGLLLVGHDNIVNVGEKCLVLFVPADGSNPTLYTISEQGEVTEKTLANQDDLDDVTRMLQSDLNMVFQEIAYKQNVIDANNPLSADYIAETNNNKVMTSAERTKLAGISAGAEVNVQSNWNETNSSSDAYIQNKPINVSAFTNDAGYQDASQVGSAIASAVGGITSFEYEVVQTLPASGVAGKIYLVANSGTTSNIYDEYIWVNNGFEKIGTTDIDLSGYATTQDLNDGLATKANAIDPSDLPQGSTQNGVITTDDHTAIDGGAVEEGQIVVDSTDGKVYIVSDITSDPQTGDPVIVWKEIQTEDEVVYIPMTVTSVQNMTFTVTYTVAEVKAMLDAGLSVFYRLTLPSAVGSLAAGVYDFEVIYYNTAAVISSMTGYSGNIVLAGFATHVSSGTSYFEMRTLATSSDLANKQDLIDANHKLSADLIDNSNSTSKTYETGTGAPTTSTTGTVGELYVDSNTGKVYVCTDTTGGTYTWEEVGGTSAQTGSTAPTTSTSGDIGQVYVDTSTNTVYVCTGASGGTYTWTQVSGGPVITMTTTDPGEGVALAENHFIAVYEV